MRTVAKLLLIVMLAVFVGCGGGPKIDGSSDEAFKASLNEVRASLEPEKATQFDKAIAVIGFNHMGTLFSNPTNPEEMMTKLKEDLDGKNAEQVMKMAQEIREKKKK